MAKIGFIGVGNMGGPMAQNLIDAGHELKVFDVTQEATLPFSEAGITVVSQVKDITQDIEFLISMLPSGKIVEDLFLDVDHLLDLLSSETLLIDCSTVSAETSKRLGAMGVEKNIAVIDAPVSGGVGGAKAGTLTFICGGSETNVARAKSVLSAMGKNIFRAGDAGAGQVAKICNNMLLAVQMVGTAEALQMGVNNGLDPKVLSDIMLQSSGRNWSLELYNPYPGIMEGVPASNEYQGGFMVNLMLKDLGLALDSAEKSHSETPMGALAKLLYDAHADEGNGLLDFSSIQKMFVKES